MTTARIGDITIEYDVHGPGDGEAIVLLMGLGMQMIAWREDLLALLADEGFRVIRMDNRDVGMSSKTSGPPPRRQHVVGALVHRRLTRPDYTLENMASDVAGLLDALQVPAAHVVGASMGGMIAQELAIGWPGRVLSLCSIMSNTGDKRHGALDPSLLPALRRTMFAPPPTSRAARVERTVEIFRVISGPHFAEDDIRRLAEASADRSDDVVGPTRQLIALNASPDRTRRLRQVRVPTLVVHGLRDRLVTPSGGIATTRAVNNSRLVMFPDMAHDLPTPRLPEIAEEIVRNARRASTAR